MIVAFDVEMPKILLFFQKVVWILSVKHAIKETGIPTVAKDDPKKKEVESMILEMISIIVAFFIMMFLNNGYFSTNNIVPYLDYPTLICMLLLIMPILLKNGMWKSLICAFKLQRKSFTCSLSDMKRSLDVVELMQKQILYAGVIVAGISVIYVLFTQSANDINAIAICLGVALIPILYTAIAELLFLPLQVEIKRRIIDYMEEE